MAFVSSQSVELEGDAHSADSRLCGLLKVAVAKQELGARGARPSTSGRSGSDMMESNHKFPASRLKTDQFFLHWLAQPENQELVWQLVEDSRNKRPLKGPTSLSPKSTPKSPRQPSTASSPTSPSISGPPASPSKLASPSSPLARSTTCLPSSESSDSAIPRFYFGVRAPEEAAIESFTSNVAAAFDDVGGAVTPRELHALLPAITECPGYLAYQVFDKALTSSDSGKLGVDAFVTWWLRRGLLDADSSKCVFEALRADDATAVHASDLLDFMTHVLAYHPGLEFLQDTQEFQERYANTVVYRILYMLDRSEKGVLTLADLRRGDLASAMARLDTEEDINKILRFFSYEHFYVMYCKFWELDSDHDFKLDRDDLLRYGGHGLTYRVVDRIFSQAPRQLKCETPGRMGYEDFVYFILSEEDKTTDASLGYWFRCLDLDYDGVVTAQDMQWFYEEQSHRMESASQAPVSFSDVMCQTADMINPEVPGQYTLRDLRRARQLAGTLFNILFNVSKFMAYETRDPFITRQEKAEEPDMSDWDLFARLEYHRLALEEETEEGEALDGGLSDGAAWGQADGPLEPMDTGNSVGSFLA